MPGGSCGRNQTQSILGNRDHFPHCSHNRYRFHCLVQYRPSPPIEIVLPTEHAINGNISINGAVTNPGIYQFSGSDTIESLIQSAGGVTANGKSDNLQLNVPQTNVTETPQKININSAAEWLLEALPGIGPPGRKQLLIIDRKTVSSAASTN